MAESRAKMLARLKEMRRKHGLGEFKNTSNSKKKSRSKTKKVRTMVKRRKSTTRRRSSKSFMGGFGKKLMGVGGYVLFETIAEPILAQWIPNQYMDMAELGVGLYLSNKGGIIGDVAKVMVTINTYSLMKQYLAPMVISATGNLFQ